MVNIAKVDLDLISDADIYLFFENSMRRGVSHISKRDSNVNNRYISFGSR